MKTLTNAHQWNEIIFENRNKVYGAYDLRETYEERIVRSLFFCFAFITTVIATPLIISHYFSKAVDIKTDKGITWDPFTVEKTTKPVTPLPAKKQQASPRKADSAPVVTGRDTVVNTMERDTTGSTPSVSILTASIGTVSGASDAHGNSEEGMTIPVEQPVVHSAWQVDKMPEFIGGTDAFNNFFSKHTRYPGEAREQGREGVVYVSFVINAEGNVTNVKVQHGGGYGFDEEAIDVVSRMPKWKPGMAHGESVSTSMVLPVRFVLMK